MRAHCRLLLLLSLILRLKLYLLYARQIYILQSLDFLFQLVIMLIDLFLVVFIWLVHWIPCVWLHIVESISILRWLLFVDHRHVDRVQVPRGAWRPQGPVFQRTLGQDGGTRTWLLTKGRVGSLGFGPSIPWLDAPQSHKELITSWNF